MSAASRWRAGLSGAGPTLASMLACAVFTVVLLHPLEATGQDLPRKGFWLESATGTGAARNACSGCDDVTVAYGSASHLRLGGALSSRVFLGLEIFALDASGVVLGPGAGAVEGENASIAPIVLWYVGDSGFFLKGGAGLARGTFTVDSEALEPVTTTRTGSGLTFGVGFDIALTGWLALTANFGTYVTAIGDVRVGTAVIDDVIATIYEANVGVTLR